MASPAKEDLADPNKGLVVIPAYNPDARLANLADALWDAGFDLVVVDDGSAAPGSGEAFAELERRAALRGAGALALLRHERNRGKGAALKTAFAHVAARRPGAGLVTADADGQHTVADIRRVWDALQSGAAGLVLGVRDFSTADVPWKSRWGNRITSAVFAWESGVRCGDTQTGLRGIPAKLVAASLNIPGDRFEYEMNALLAFAREAPFKQIPIETVYIENNRATSFRAVRDSARIYLNILRFGASSAISAVADVTAFTLLASYATGRTASGLLYATVIARLFSGALNYWLNHKLVFSRGESAAFSAPRYLLLFCAQMALSWLFVTALSKLPIPLVFTKAIADVTLFFFSYHIQSRFIFTRRRPAAEEGGRAG